MAGEHIPNLERIILGGWLESQAKDGKIEVDAQRFEDVRTGVRLALEWFPRTFGETARNHIGDVINMVGEPESKGQGQ